MSLLFILFVKEGEHLFLLGNHAVKEKFHREIVGFLWSFVFKNTDTTH